MIGINNLIGSAYNDNLVGNRNANILLGGEGRDYLVGGAGADILDGGQGSDVALYHLADKGVRVDLSLTKAQEDFDGTLGFDANGNEAVGDILIGIENMWGSTHADFLSGDEGNNKIHGNDGNDLLEGGKGDDYLHGGRGNDKLYGGEGDDNLAGDYGDDILYGGAGNDFIQGDSGYSYITGDDILHGGEGNDRLEGGRGADTYQFSINDGIDTIVDRAGETMTLQFLNGYHGSYTTDDFTFSSESFARVGNNLEITLGKNSEGDIGVGNNLEITQDKNPYADVADKITILNAFDTNPDTGTGNAAFTINIEYGSEGSFTEVTDSFWHSL